MPAGVEHAVGPGSRGTLVIVEVPQDGVPPGEVPQDKVLQDEVPPGEEPQEAGPVQECVTA